MQNHYSLIYREEEREMFPTLKVRYAHSHKYSASPNVISISVVRRRVDPLVPARPRPAHASAQRAVHARRHGLVHQELQRRGHPRRDQPVRPVLASLSLLYCDYSRSEHIKYSVEQIAKARGVSMAQIAIAWVLSKPGVTAPIVGTTSLDNLKDIIGASSRFDRLRLSNAN